MRGAAFLYLVSEREEKRSGKSKKYGIFCSECGYESAKWFGQCPACKAWNTFVEEPIASKSSG